MVPRFLPLKQAILQASWQVWTNSVLMSLNFPDMTWDPWLRRGGKTIQQPLNSPSACPSHLKTVAISSNTLILQNNRWQIIRIRPSRQIPICRCPFRPGPSAKPVRSHLCFPAPAIISRAWDEEYPSGGRKFFKNRTWRTAV